MANNEREAQLNVSQAVKLDASGNGIIDFSVDNAWQRWVITGVVVSTNQAAGTPIPLAAVYAGPLTSKFLQGVSQSGNQDTFRGTVETDDGTDLHVEFISGQPGSIATAMVTGKKYTRIA